MSVTVWISAPLMDLLKMVALALIFGFAYVVYSARLPVKYNFQNVRVRWRSTWATVVGVALVVAVFVVVQSLGVGLEKSAQNTGDPRNIMIVRKGATAESSSQVTREQFKLIQNLPQIARDEADRPVVSADVIVLLSLPRKTDAGEANVVLRGITPVGMKLRPQVRLAEGRWFEPGKREVVVSRKMAARFANFGLGQTFRTGSKELTVVGWTDGGNSAFDSEIWMDSDESRSLFDRENYSSILVRLNRPEAEGSFTNRVEKDKRLPLRALRETDYYSAQTMTALPFLFLGKFLAVIMSIGATFAAMNTMYASVGARTREIGTLRVLGFRRRAVLVSFILEGVLLSLLGGCIGAAGAWAFSQSYLWLFGGMGMINFQSFSETVFQFQLTWRLIGQGLIFSVIVGVLGSLWPAWRAARLPVIASLKSL